MKKYIKQILSITGLLSLAVGLHAADTVTIKNETGENLGKVRIKVKLESTKDAVIQKHWSKGSVHIKDGIKAGATGSVDLATAARWNENISKSDRDWDNSEHRALLLDKNKNLGSDYKFHIVKLKVAPIDSKDKSEDGTGKSLINVKFAQEEDMLRRSFVIKKEDGKFVLLDDKENKIGAKPRKTKEQKEEKKKMKSEKKDKKAKKETSSDTDSESKKLAEAKAAEILAATTE